MTLKTPAEQTVDRPLGLQDSKDVIQSGTGLWLIRTMTHNGATRCLCDSEPCRIKAVDARDPEAEPIDRGLVADFTDLPRSVIYEDIMNRVDWSTFNASDFRALACQECRGLAARLFEDTAVFPIPAENEGDDARKSQ